MKLFDVYPLYDITLQEAKGSYLYDDQGKKYLDLYGGHAVISIGHGHAHYVNRIRDQLSKIGFFSNAVKNPLQQELADKLGKISGLEDYQLFMVNSGAEANENALKLASFHTGRKRIVSFNHAFHGRTSLATAVTDNEKIKAPVNKTHDVIQLPLNDIEALDATLRTGQIAAVIIEGIQGVGGVYEADDNFLQRIRSLCDDYKTVFIADSVQCGYGRSGMFFAHDRAGVKADIYTMAKGMGNGFPVGAMAVSSVFEPVHGMLGTTFGGNHLACAASLAVLEVMEQENLIQHASEMGEYLKKHLQKTEGITAIRGRGLMIGIELEQDASGLRKKLLYDYQIFTGGAANKNTIRVLPPLNITKEALDQFINALQAELQLRNQSV